jgi:hypothetical protein
MFVAVMCMISHQQLALKRSQYAGQLIRLPHRPLPSALHPLFLQIIKVQEDPSNIPEGETPRSLLMYAFDTNVDACKPGDKVTCTGEGHGGSLSTAPPAAGSSQAGCCFDHTCGPWGPLSNPRKSQRGQDAQTRQLTHSRDVAPGMV